MTHSGPEIHNYAEEICPNVIAGATNTILLRINFCCG